MIGEMQIRQICALVKDGMTPEQIASSLDIDVALVKLAVARNGQDGDRDIDDETLKTLRSHAVALALHAEDEAVQARMTQYLIDRDKPRQVQATLNPITLINQALVMANGKFDELVQRYQEKKVES